MSFLSNICDVTEIDVWVNMFDMKLTEMSLSTKISKTKTKIKIREI